MVATLALRITASCKNNNLLNGVAVGSSTATFLLKGNKTI